MSSFTTDVCICAHGCACVRKGMQAYTCGPVLEKLVTKTIAEVIYG